MNYTKINNIQYSLHAQAGRNEQRNSEFSGQNSSSCQPINKPSFTASASPEGGIGVKALSGIDWLMRKIERGGFFAEFLVVDLAGMIIPRTVQAYLRNREELGHLNHKAGREEAIREFLTGPSMFLIPMGFLFASKKIFGSASHIKLRTLKEFKNVASDAIKHTDSGDKIIRGFYENIVNKLYGNKVSEKVSQTIVEGFEKLHNAQLKQDSEKIHGFFNKVKAFFRKPESKDVKKFRDELTESLINANKSVGGDTARGISLVDASNMKFLDKHSSVGGIIEDCMNYSTDVLEKLKNAGIEKQTLLNKIHEFKQGARGIITTVAVGTVAAALYYIPHLYKQNKQFPGIDGLTEAPANDNMKRKGAA